VYEYVYEYDCRIGENRSLSYTYSCTLISPCQGSSTAVSRLNFLHHRRKADGMAKGYQKPGLAICLISRARG